MGVLVSQKITILFNSRMLRTCPFQFAVERKNSSKITWNSKMFGLVSVSVLCFCMLIYHLSEFRYFSRFSFRQNKYVRSFVTCFAAESCQMENKSLWFTYLF